MAGVGQVGGLNKSREELEKLREMEELRDLGKLGKRVGNLMQAVGEVKGVRHVTGCGESLGCWGS